MTPLLCSNSRLSQFLSQRPTEFCPTAVICQRQEGIHYMLAETSRGVICDAILWSRESLWIIIVTLSTTSDRGFNFDFNISQNRGKVEPIRGGAKLFKLGLWQENQLKERRRAIIHEIYCIQEEIRKKASRYYKLIQISTATPNIAPTPWPGQILMTLRHKSPARPIFLSWRDGK